MKIKILLFCLSAGLVLASCSDKEAEAKMQQMATDMMRADSTCKAGMMMMQTQMDSLQGMIDSMMMAKNTVSSGTSKKAPEKGEIKVNTSKGVDVKTKSGGTNSTIDIKKKGGANSTSGGGK